MNIAAQALLSSADAGDDGSRSLPRRILDFVFGYDFFISYSWSDGAAYASALVSRLEADGFQVFLDRASYASGDDARVWNARTGEVIAVLERHHKTVCLLRSTRMAGASSQPSDPSSSVSCQLARRHLVRRVHAKPHGAPTLY